MSGPDPQLHSLGLRRRCSRIMRVAGVFSLAIAALAVALFARGGDHLHIHMLIAAALGAGLTVLLGAALISLVFLSKANGHDDRGTRSHPEEKT